MEVLHFCLFSRRHLEKVVRLGFHKKYLMWMTIYIFTLTFSTVENTSKSNVLFMSCLDNLVGMVIGGTKSRTQEHYYQLNVVWPCMCMLLFASPQQARLLLLPCPSPLVGPAMRGPHDISPAGVLLVGVVCTDTLLLWGMNCCRGCIFLRRLWRNWLKAKSRRGLSA
jgi:hypothetical protein